MKLFQAGRWRIVVALWGALGAGPADSAALARSPAVNSVLAGQAALDRAGFSPGVIDGQAGHKTAIALKAFQAAHGLPQTGQFDPTTAAALHMSGAAATVNYTVTAADLRAVGAVDMPR